MDRYHSFGLGALMLAACLAPSRAVAGLPPEAVELLNRSIAAHATAPAKVRLLYRGLGSYPDQSSRPEPPFTKHPGEIALAIDEAAGSISFVNEASIDGDFTFTTRIGFADGRGYATSYTGEYDLISAFPAAADGILPHRLLKGVLDTATSGTVTRDRTYDRLSFTALSGARTLLFDRNTHLLARTIRPPAPSAYGDQVRETIYGAYRRVGNAMVPGAVTFRVNSPVLGTTDVNRRLVAASTEGPRAGELVPPPGAAQHAAVSRELAIEQLGRDVYLLRNAATEGQFSYNVLVVVFADQALVVEAALNDATSQKVIAEVAKLAPGKPIRTLVQTHHHADHIGGIRTYIAAGATILAPTGLHRLIDRIAAAHSVVAPDALARSPRPALVEEVGRERIVTAPGNQVRLYDLPNDHSSHMLVVYLPAERILYQGDLISAGEIPINDTSRRFLKWLAAKRLPVDTLAGLHGRTVKGDELRTLLRQHK